MSRYSFNRLIRNENPSKTEPESNAGMADASGMGLGVTLSPELLDQIQMVSYGFLNLNANMDAMD